jgi:hypothetical protein
MYLLDSTRLFLYVLRLILFILFSLLYFLYFLYFLYILFFFSNGYEDEQQCKIVHCQNFSDYVVLSLQREKKDRVCQA